jgi:hypothetical protein
VSLFAHQAMNTQTRAADKSDAAVPARSAESRAFEAMWKSLRHGTLIPLRSHFKPRLAVPFLQNIVLTEIPQFDGDGVRVRLVGSGFERRIQRNIAGVNYLDHLPEKFHADALQSIRLIFSQPCGLWQIMTMHYERMFAEPLEVTILPLSGDADRPSILLNYVKPVPQVAQPTPTNGMAMRVDTASHFQFIDVGAGVPDWPPQRG